MNLEIPSNSDPINPIHGQEQQQDEKKKKSLLKKGNPYLILSSGLSSQPRKRMAPGSIFLQLIRPHRY